MIPAKVECPYCSATISVASYRKFVVCPYCDNKFDFEGFEYCEIDPTASMYSKIKYEQDCPSCRSKHMFLLSSSRKWKCIDCGYQISSLKKFFGVFWFCDNCETFMNIQDGFNTKRGKWICTECHFENSTTKNDIW